MLAESVVSSTSTIQEIHDTVTLLSITELEEDPVTVAKVLEHLDIRADLTVTSGLKTKSRWCPNLSSGSNIEIFHRLVIKDLDEYIDKHGPSLGIRKDNLTPNE